MHAVVIRAPGGPEVLAWTQVADPNLRDGEVLVRVRATALNRADLLQRRGHYPPPAGASEIPGLEFAGEVAESGAGTKRWKVSERVFGITAGGAHAEYVAVHEDLLTAVPEQLDWIHAAAVPEVFITAHDALRQAELKAGDGVLIHAVGSGVGLAATQLVSALGGKAFGTSRTADKIERAREFGLSDGFVVPEAAALAGLANFARRVTDGGFEIVLDLNGGPYFAASLAALVQRGRLVLIGSTAGPKTEVDLRTVLSKRLRIIGTVLRARPLEEKIEVTRAFAAAVVPLLAANKVRPVIDSVFPIARIRAAHERLESNETFGKVVLTVA